MGIEQSARLHTEGISTIQQFVKIARVMSMAIISLVVALHLDSARADNIDTLNDISSDYNGSLAARPTPAHLVPSGLFSTEDFVFAVPSWNPNPLDEGKGYLFFVLDAPITWNSNPTAVASGAHASGRFDPKLQLNAAYQTSSVQLSLQSTVDDDRYFSNGAADTDGVQSTIKASLRCAHNSAAPACNGNTDLGTHVVPYLFFQSSLKFSEGFGHLKSNQSDIGLGVSFDSSFLHLPKPDNSKPDAYPYPQAGLAAELTRRYSNVGADSVSIYVKSSITENFSPTFALSFQPSLRARWFDSLAGVSREDNTVIFPAVVAWDPPILKSLHPEIRLSLNVTRTWSNVLSKNAEQWDVGPWVELIAVPLDGSD